MPRRKLRGALLPLASRNWMSVTRGPSCDLARNTLSCAISRPCSLLQLEVGGLNGEPTRVRRRKPAAASSILASSKTTCLVPDYIGKYVPGNGFTIAAAHTDSPCLRVKPVSTLTKSGYLSVGVETYGGKFEGMEVCFVLPYLFNGSGLADLAPSLWRRLRSNRFANMTYAASYCSPRASTCAELMVAANTCVLLCVVTRRHALLGPTHARASADALLAGGLWYSWLDRDLSVAGRAVVRTAKGNFDSQLVRIDRPILRIPSLAIHLNREVNK